MDYDTAAAIIAALRARARELLIDRGGLIGLLAFAIYAWLARDYVVDGDNAELSALGALGGAAHPSGYPLYVLILRATSWLPGSPAHGAALVTAALAAASLVVLHAACRAWGARAACAAVAVAMFAAAPVVMRMSSQAEVWALDDLAVAAVLLLSARSGPLRGGRRALALGLVAGLGMANHLTCALVAPVGLLGVVRAMREDRARVLGLAIGGLVVGLVPYAYLVIATPSAASWGGLDSLGALIDHVLRRDYGGPGAFAGDGAAVSAWANEAALAQALGRATLWLPGLVGLVALARRAVTGDDRWSWSMLAVSFVLTGPLLVLRFNIPPEDLGAYVVARFHILPALMLVIPVAVGLDPVLARLPRLAEAAGPAILAVASAASLPYVASRHTATMQHGVAGILEALPPRAVAIVSSDDLYFGAAYLQGVNGVRRDVTIVMWPLMILDWYRARVGMLGVTVPPGDGPASARIAAALLAAGRPVFIDSVEKHVRERLPVVPFAGLFRVYPASAPPPSLDELIAANREAYGKIDLDDPQPGPDDDLATAMRSRLAETWFLLGKALAKAGRSGDAAAALDLATKIGPSP